MIINVDFWFTDSSDFFTVSGERFGDMDYGKEKLDPPRLEYVQFRGDEYVSTCIQCNTEPENAVNYGYLMLEADGNSAAGQYWEDLSLEAHFSAALQTGDTEAPYGNAYYQKLFELTENSTYQVDQLIFVNDNLTLGDYYNELGHTDCGGYFKPGKTYKGWFNGTIANMGSQTTWERALIWFDALTTKIHATTFVDNNWNYTGKTSNKS